MTLLVNNQTLAHQGEVGYGSLAAGSPTNAGTVTCSSSAFDVDLPDGSTLSAFGYDADNGSITGNAWITSDARELTLAVVAGTSASVYVGLSGRVGAFDTLRLSGTDGDFDLNFADAEQTADGSGYYWAAGVPADRDGTFAASASVSVSVFFAADTQGGIIAGNDIAVDFSGLTRSESPDLTASGLPNAGRFSGGTGGLTFSTALSGFLGDSAARVGCRRALEAAGFSADNNERYRLRDISESQLPCSSSVLTYRDGRTGYVLTGARATASIAITAGEEIRLALTVTGKMDKPATLGETPAAPLQPLAFIARNITLTLTDEDDADLSSLIDSVSAFSMDLGRGLEALPSLSDENAVGAVSVSSWQPTFDIVFTIADAGTSPIGIEELYSGRRLKITIQIDDQPNGARNRVLFTLPQIEITALAPAATAGLIQHNLTGRAVQNGSGDLLAEFSRVAS